MTVYCPEDAHQQRNIRGDSLSGRVPCDFCLSCIEMRCKCTDTLVQSAPFIEVGLWNKGRSFVPFGVFRCEAAFSPWALGLYACFLDGDNKGTAVHHARVCHVLICFGIGTNDQGS